MYLTTWPSVYGGVSSCNYMYSGCTSLNSVEVDFTSWPTGGFGSTGGLANWLQNTASMGTFTCPSGLSMANRGSSFVPSNWTVVRSNAT